MSTTADGAAASREPSRLRRAVQFWAERLTREDGAPGHALRRSALEAQLAAILRPLYLDSALDKPEICPVQTQERLRRALRALDEVVGVAAEAVNALVLRILEHGQSALGWFVPEPVDVLLRLPRELPVLVEADFVGLAALKRLETGLDAAVNRLPSWSAAARAGHVLHRALILGGLLRTHLINGWLALQATDLTVTAFGSWVEIQLAAEDMTAEAPQPERWLLRPELELVLLAYWRDFPEQPLGGGKTPWALLRAYYAAAGIQPEWQPATFAQVKRWARARQALALPPMFVAVLTGEVVSSALPATAHRRFCTGEPCWQADDQRDPVVKAATPAAVFALGAKRARPLPTHEDRALKRIFRALYKPQAGRLAVRRELESRMQAEAPHLSLAGRAIATWTHHLLAHETKQRKIATIRRYVQPVRRYVLPRLRHADIDTLSGEDWRAALQAAIDETNDSLAPLAIYLFARFVTLQPDGPTFDVEELEGLDSVHRVRPNLLSVTDFERAMQQLHTPAPRDERMARLIGVLGFYAGLRRNEALCLRLGDLQGEHQLWLTVRTNRYRQVKSYAGQRLLPLHALLPDHWLRQLLAWRAMRTDEGGAHAREQLLFCALNKAFSPLPAEQLVTPVRDAIRAVTGDYSLVFHQLRHSFASWTLVRLLAPELPLPHWQQRFAALAHPWFDTSACTALRRWLLGVTGDTQPVRHAAYALARLLGHQQVATTFRAYIHLAAWMIWGLQTRQGTLAMGEAEVCALLGFPAANAGSSAAYQRWRRLCRKAGSPASGGLAPEPLLQVARAEGRFAGADWPSAIVVPDARAPVVTTLPYQSSPLRLDQLPALLGALYQEGRTIDRIAEEFQLDPRQVQQVRDAAQALAAQRTKAAAKQRFTMPPKATSSEADGDALKIIIRQLEASDLDWPTIEAGIGLLDRTNPSRGHRILFQDEAPARRFVAMLLALGFPQAQLRADLYPQEGAVAENQRHWSQCLGIPVAHIAIKSLVRSPGARHGAISIGITRPRAYSRLRPAAEDGGDYDAAVAKRALAGFETRAVGDALHWRLADAQQVADLVTLLRWFGIPADALTTHREDADVRVALRHPVDAATVRHARQLLARSLPYHGLRVVSADPRDTRAVIELLLACGVEGSLLNVEFSGTWDPAKSDVLMSTFAADYGLGDAQLQRKQRKGREPTLSLTVGIARGHEQIHAWSLTYALVMVRIFVDAGAPRVSHQQR